MHGVRPLWCYDTSTNHHVQCRDEVKDEDDNQLRNETCLALQKRIKATDHCNRKKRKDTVSPIYLSSVRSGIDNTVLRCVVIIKCRLRSVEMVHGFVILESVGNTTIFPVFRN